MQKLSTLIFIVLLCACGRTGKTPETLKPASEIFGKPEYRAISFGGYREKSREQVPSVANLKEDIRILHAMGVKLLRTYNTQQFAQASNLLKAIREVKNEDPNFEMYVMLGAWIDCKGAWTSDTDHEKESLENNEAEIAAAVAMANEYPDIVKAIAVGNEAMIHWASSYYVVPGIILKWVNHLQGLKSEGKLPNGVWITSSDNYESWGGGGKSYHLEDLDKLIEAVDFVSLHTYPYHETHFNPGFWLSPESEDGLTDIERINNAMARSIEFAKGQFESAAAYVRNIDPNKPIHIGETGWATISSEHYGDDGTKASDQYKEKLYHDMLREWTEKEGIACFYFEAFDEQWKDDDDPNGSENHFGLINLKGEAKYALWDMVDAGVFEGLTRNGYEITKTLGGDEEALLSSVLTPPSINDGGGFQLPGMNESRNPGEVITENTLVMVPKDMDAPLAADATYPSTIFRITSWEGSCHLELLENGLLDIVTGTGDWWGGAMEITGPMGENLTAFENGTLNFEIKGDTKASFELGFQTGAFADGDQVNHSVFFSADDPNYQLSESWKSYSIPLKTLSEQNMFTNVRSLFFVRGAENFDGKKIELRNIRYEQ